MLVVVTGISHKTAPLDLRERLALSDEETLRVARELVEEGAACECVALSTCNRTELYLYAGDSLAARQAAVERLSRHAGVAAGELEPSLYSYSGDGAIAHLFRVTASLDSMVVGEAQIVAQMKAAYQQACEGGCTSVVFNRLFRHALEVGKRVRTETAIGERPVSVSSAAVELALQVFGKFRDHTVLIIGAGETSELTATHLKAHGIEKILVTNRTLATAAGAGACGERPRRALRGPRSAPGGRRHRHQLHLGAATTWSRASWSSAPSSIAATGPSSSSTSPCRATSTRTSTACATPTSTTSTTCRTWWTRTAASARRRRTTPSASSARSSTSVNDWLRSLEVVPTIATLRETVEQIRRSELERLGAKLGDLTDEQRAQVEMITTSIVNKILHMPR